MASSEPRYFKGTPCHWCSKPVNDDENILYALTLDYSTESVPKLFLFHNSPNCFERYLHSSQEEGAAASYSPVKLGDRPTLEDFVNRSFRVIASPQKLADKIIGHYKNTLHTDLQYTDVGVNGAKTNDLTRLGIVPDSITKAILLYPQTTYINLGKVIKRLKTHVTFEVEALLVQNTKNPKTAYVLPFFKEPITPRLMKNLSIDVTT